MANNGLVKALEGAALATLGRAAGQDFLGPALEDQRLRDRFVFQQQQLQAASDRERARVRAETTASQRGLLQSLSAVGAFRPEDLAASGGPDLLAGLDPRDFEVALSQMKENRLRDVSEEDFKRIIQARAAASGYTIHRDANIQTYREVAARLDMQDLEKAQWEDESKESFQRHARELDALEGDVSDLLRSPARINPGVLGQVTGRFEVLSRKLSKEEGMDPDDRDFLQGRLLNRQRALLTDMTEAAAINEVSAGTPKQIFEAYASEPALRERLAEKNQVLFEKARRGAALLRNLDASDVEKQRLGGLKEALVGIGEGDAFLTENPELAAGLADVADREYSIVKAAEERQRDTQAASKFRAGAVETMRRNFPEFAEGAPDPIGYIENGVANEEAYVSDFLAPLLSSVSAMPRGDLLSLERRLRRAGVGGATLALVENRLAGLVAEDGPGSLLTRLAEDESLDYDDVQMAAAGEMLAERSKAEWTGPWYNQRLVPGSYQGPGNLGWTGLRSTWISGMSDAFKSLDASLSDYQQEIEKSIRVTAASSVDFPDGSDTRAQYNSYLLRLQQAHEPLVARQAVRGTLKSLLPTMGFADAEGAADALFAFSGGKTADVEKKQQVRDAAGSREGLLGEIQTALLESARTDAQREAVGAELTMLKELAARIEGSLDGEDRDERLRALKKAGIISSADSDYPELEIVAYFMGNQ